MKASLIPGLVTVCLLILYAGDGGAYIQEEPCLSYPGVCKPRGECPGGSLTKINEQYSCPTSPDDIECCPSGGGGGDGGYVQEEPCMSYPGVCKKRSDCPGGALAEINGHFSCPSSPNEVECCPTGGGGGGSSYVQEEPCTSVPGVCKPSSQCLGGSLAKVGGRFSCPSSPNDIECCPTGGGGGNPNPGSPSTYSRCEMYRKLQSYGFSDINNWVCLIEKESGRRTGAIGKPNWDGSRDYGLFQINSKYWCGLNGPGGDCHVSCASLTDTDLDNDIACARLIYKRHGFNAWYGWKNGCRGSVAQYGC